MPTPVGLKVRRWPEADTFVGQKFNRLRALAVVSGKRHHLRCMCDCGRECETNKYDLVSGDQQSCGCLQRERAGAAQTARKGIAIYQDTPLRYAWRNYKHNAKTRGLVFEITKDQFHVLAQQPCEYCGLSPSRNYKAVNQRGEGYIGSGIDRVDSARGYTLDNCVPCCKQCNVAKMSMPRHEFLEWCERVVSHQSRLREVVA